MRTKTADEIKVDELSKRLNKILGNSPTKSSSFKTFKKSSKDLSFVNNLTGIDLVKMKSGKDGIDGKDGSPDTPQEIANKLNTLVEAIEASVIKGLPKVKDLIDELKKGQYLEPKNIKGLPINMNDMRWHGSGGLSSVSHDATLSGNGTSASPLSVVGGVGIPVKGEVVDGSGTTFTLDFAPATGTLALFGAGQRLFETSEYSVVGVVITTVQPWSAGQILADYNH